MKRDILGVHWKKVLLMVAPGTEVTVPKGSNIGSLRTTAAQLKKKGAGRWSIKIQEDKSIKITRTE